MDVDTDKLDLYSIPVFILEVIVLIGLTYSAHYIHFQYKQEPYLSGFYCDDISLRNEYSESKLTQQFTQPDNEIVVLALLLAVPITVIIFCELVNSMFGSLKFRKIRSLCQCCKLHSITRRTVRFAGAYIFGFLIVMISCNIIANTTGQLKPYFAQECPQAYRDCSAQLAQPESTFANGGGAQLQPSSSASTFRPSTAPSELLENTSPPAPSGANPIQSGDNLRPPSAPILSNSTVPITNPLPPPAKLIRFRRDTSRAAIRLVERQWIMLSGVNLADLCQFSGDSLQTRKFDHLAMSWPSFPASIITYACLYIAIYLCFVGTARPFRLITSVLVVLVLLLAMIFNVQLVKEHFNHWQDVVAGAILALVVVIFVLIVYLNKFRDSHYYENQKVLKRGYLNDTNNNYNGYSNEIALEQYNLDKTDEPVTTNGANSGGNNQNGDTGGSVPNNDLAMRYFQIPRANYRGAPRPLSNATNHM